jgi:iron complex transport system substrate-binding protein
MPQPTAFPPRPADPSRRAFAAALVAVALAPAGCKRNADAGGPFGERLVSVGGALTEAVVALGAEGLLVGVDTSSVHPASVKKLSQIGYQRALSAEGVIALRPTLVVASPDAGPASSLAQIRDAGVRLEIIAAENSGEGAKDKLRTLARLLGRDAAAGPLLEAIDRDLRVAAEVVAASPRRLKVLPLLVRGGQGAFVAGRNTAADAMLRLAGAENAAANVEGNKPLTAESVVAAAPEVLLATTASLGSGGLDGIFALPGVSETPAGKARRALIIDDLKLLGFGPRTGMAVLEIARGLRSLPGGSP